jgi:outer membrane protein
LKKALYQVVVLALGLTIGGSAISQNLKVGFVNPARVSAEAPQAEAARQKLEREFAPRDQELVAMQKDVRQLEERLNRDGAVMRESEQRELEREIIARKRDIRRIQDEFREDFNMRRNEELGRLQRHIIETIHALAKEDKFDLIVSDGVIFASEQIDITNQVIERLSKEQRGAAKR